MSSTAASSRKTCSSCTGKGAQLVPRPKSSLASPAVPCLPHQLYCSTPCLPREPTACMQAGLLWCYQSMQGKEAAGEETDEQKKIAGKLHSSTLSDSIPPWHRAAVIKSSQGSGCLLCTRAVCGIRTPCTGFSVSLYYLF